MMKFLETPDSIPMLEVVSQYDSFFQLGLTDPEKSELIESLLGRTSPGSHRVHEPRPAPNSINDSINRRSSS